MAPGQKLFDKIIDGDLMAGALAFAAEKAADASGAPLPLVRNLKVDASERRRLLAVRAQHRRRDGEATSRRRCKCVECVAAALKLPFDDGMRIERETFLALMMTPECKALRHVFFGRARDEQDPRRAGRHADARRSSKVAVIGAGTMGGGIAMNFLNAGIPVVMLEMKQEALDKGVGDDAQELRGAGQEGQAQAGQVRRSAWRC